MTGDAGAAVQWVMRMERERPGRTYEVTERKPKRSLDANAYYWALLSKLADALRLPKPRAHNLMLRRYGQPEMIGGRLVRTPIPDTDEAEERTLDAEAFHLKPTSHVREGMDGTTYRTYLLLRGSSTYDSREFSVLLDGLISEAGEQGIETLPPHEIEKMYEELRKREERHAKKIHRDG